jgi:hypothetical protein
VITPTPIANPSNDPVIAFLTFIVVFLSICVSSVQALDVCPRVR